MSPVLAPAPVETVTRLPIVWDVPSNPPAGERWYAPGEFLVTDPDTGEVRQVICEF